MKKIIPLIIIILTALIPLQAQQRDRRTDLKLGCGYSITLSNTGMLWMHDRCGHVYVADGIHSTWRTAIDPGDGFGSTYERVGAFGNHTAVVAGFIASRGSSTRNYDYVLRTTDGGQQWDTVVVDPALKWVHALCAHADGHMWLGSASGRSSGVLAYSADSGRTFSVLRHEFDTVGGIHTLYMTTADSGFAGTYYNRIVSTSDNWRTFHRLPTPMDQGLVPNRTYQSLWINRVRHWKNHLIVTESDGTFITSLEDEIHWQKPPIGIADYEVDTLTGALWVITDSGQLAWMEDLEHWHIVGNGADYPVGNICGVLDGKVYMRTSDGVVRVGTDGMADTCGYFTTEQPIEEPPLIGSNGSRLWGTDGNSVYILDAKGWYRVAKPRSVQSLLPDPDRSDRMIILRGDGHTYSIDADGHMESFIWRQPLDGFVQSGLQSLDIETYRAGCFHYLPQTVSYHRRNGQLSESSKGKHQLPVADVEQALLHLGEHYSLFPAPQDFGLKDTTVDLHAVYANDGYWSTSSVGYKLTFINSTSDTLLIYGHVSEGNDLGDKTRFPWLLPMNIHWRGAEFVSYQPCLWQALRALMPDTMFLRDQLDNSTLHPRHELQTGDLLFVSDTSGMGQAVKESTGNYTHVALVERDKDERLWIIDATQKHGVARRPFASTFADRMPFDAYRLAVPFDTAAVIARAMALVGKPYDDTFLPDNDAYYCSELIQMAFDTLFPSTPMNWRDKNGNLPQYWQEHFKKLGMPVPEGVMGTNPTDLSHSPRLHKLN